MYSWRVPAELPRPRMPGGGPDQRSALLGTRRTAGARAEPNRQVANFSTDNAYPYATPTSIIIQSSCRARRRIMRPRMPRAAGAALAPCASVVREM